jgi:limonene-1,2-epoxide hydrolase
MWSGYSDEEGRGLPHPPYNGSAAATPISHDLLSSSTPFAPQHLTVAPPPVQRRARPRLRVILLLAALVLVVGAGGALWFAFSRPSPSRTLAAFCSALTAHDAASAYSQLSPALQRQVAPAIFSGLLGATQNCTYSSPVIQGSLATANLSLLRAGQMDREPVRLVRTEAGAWLIDGDPALTALPALLSAYCAALVRGDVQTAYAHLTAAFQGRVSARLYALLVTGVTACRARLESASSGSASALITLTYDPASQPEENSAQLQGQGAVWAIDALSTLSTPTRSLLSFCTALKNRDYQTAYELLTSSFQSRFGSQSRFVSIVDSVVKSNGGVKRCAVGGLQTRQGAVVGVNIITYANGKSESDNDQLVEEQGIWRINTIA